jgi:hypothetical protein
MKTFLSILSLAALALSLDDLNFPHNFANGDTIWASEFQANDDTLENLWNRTMDSLTGKTWDTLKVNYIRSNPDVDSISGSPKISSSVEIGQTAYPTVAIKTNNSTDGDASMTLYGYKSANGPIGYIRGYNNKVGSSFATSAIYFNRLNNDSSGSLTFFTRTHQVNLTERAIIDDSGRVGINCTPAYRFDVAGRIDCDTLSATTLTITRDTTFACSLFDGGTYRATGTARAVILGKKITLEIPTLTGTITDSTQTYINLPSKFYSDNYFWWPCKIDNGTTHEVGILVIMNSSHFILQTITGGYLTAGDGGILRTVASYLLP